MGKTAELLPGTLDMLILKAVSLKPLHGYGVLLRIQQISGDALEIPNPVVVFEVLSPGTADTGKMIDMSEDAHARVAALVVIGDEIHLNTQEAGNELLDLLHHPVEGIAVAEFSHAGHGFGANGGRD